MLANEFLKVVYYVCKTIDWRMNEDLLHHAWKFRLFDHRELITQYGEKVEVIRTGDHNLDSGPDFFNARIRIGDTEWAGNVEIHINASDWNKHRHTSDEAYRDVILHVVYNNDAAVKNSKGIVLPVIELKDKLDRSLIEKYSGLSKGAGWIPCGEQVRQVDGFLRSAWMERLLIERLERKSKEIEQTLELSRSSWEEAFYFHLARNFGFRVNASPFGLLARSLPLQVLAKHKSSLMQAEALLFGQAGMLNEHFNDDYPRALQNEYVFLQKKFRLVPLESRLWKFMRMRPTNFPTIRIAQLAALIHDSSHLFSKMLEATDVQGIEKLFNAQASTYWESHYMFDRPSPKSKKSLGKSSIDNIIINTIVPFLFVYGKKQGDERFSERAFSLLEQVEGESNNIISKWKLLGMPVHDAWSTQALLQLKSEYCDRKRCLQCAIGTKLLGT